MARIGRYELLGVLGQGSMGKVYEAQPDGGGPRVALKVLTEPDLEFMERLRREAEILRRLDGRANILRCHDVGEERGRPFFVMDLVRGGTLADALRTGQISAAEACRVVAKVAYALHAAHEVGVVHRDVKPSNILLGGDGMPWIADFGIAKDSKNRSLTESGVLIGTIAYMAPEQIDSRLRIDRRTDVYALGGILYAVFAGRTPFSGPTTELLQKILREAPAPLTSLRADMDPRMDAVCRKALAKAPDDRFATAADLARAIEAALAPAPARSRAALALGAATAGVLVVAAAFALGRASKAASPERVTAPLEAGAARPATDAPRDLVDEACLVLRAGVPLDMGRMDALARAASEAPVSTLAKTLPFLRARTALLERDLDTAARLIVLLPEGAARSLLDAELAAANGDWEDAFRILDAAGAATVPWSEPVESKRWLALARASEVASPPHAAKAYARAARAILRARPDDVVPAAALAERAFTLDGVTARAELGVSLAFVLSRAANALLEQDGPTPASIRLARRQLLVARLVRPELNLATGAAHLVRLAQSPDARIRSAARPWGHFAGPLSRGPRAQSLDKLVADAKTDADCTRLTRLLFRPPEFFPGLTAPAVREAFADLLIQRPDRGLLWVGFTLAAITVGRFGEAHAALDNAAAWTDYPRERPICSEVLAAQEAGMAFEPPPPSGEGEPPFLALFGGPGMDGDPGDEEPHGPPR